MDDGTTTATVTSTATTTTTAAAAARVSKKARKTAFFYARQKARMRAQRCAMVPALKWEELDFGDTMAVGNALPLPGVVAHVSGFLKSYFNDGIDAASVPYATISARMLKMASRACHADFGAALIISTATPTQFSVLDKDGGSFRSDGTAEWPDFLLDTMHRRAGSGTTLVAILNLGTATFTLEMANRHSGGSSTTATATATTTASGVAASGVAADNCWCEVFDVEPNEMLALGGLWHEHYTILTSAAVDGLESPPTASPLIVLFE